MEKHSFRAEAPPGLRDAWFGRADLEIYGIRHFCPSYTARIFFTELTDLADDADSRHPDYAGQFSIFGHARCLGEQGHCSPPTRERRFDTRPSHPLTPGFKRVVVTTALRRALERTDVLPISLIVDALEALDVEEGGGESEAGQERLLIIDGMQIVTFR